MHIVFKYLMLLVFTIGLGVLTGAFLGFLLAVLNNLVLAELINAAHGSYLWWSKFGATIGGMLSLIYAIFWALSVYLFSI